MIAGVDPADLPDPDAALRAIDRAPFVISIELRASAVTDRADVVFPVAAVAEKAGTFVNWEGRGGTFERALHVPEVRTDLYVLGAIADEMDVHLGLPDTAAARAELASLGVWRGARPEPPAVTGASPVSGTLGGYRNGGGPGTGISGSFGAYAGSGPWREAAPEWCTGSGSRPGTSSLTAGGCRTGSRTWREPPAPRWPGCLR